MSKITSKLQVTLPKTIAEAQGIRPGDEIVWLTTGGIIRIIPQRKHRRQLSIAQRLKLFDEASRRQDERTKNRKRKRSPMDRGCKRKDLYERHRTH